MELNQALLAVRQVIEQQNWPKQQHVVFEEALTTIESACAQNTLTKQQAIDLPPALADDNGHVHTP